MNKLPSIPKEFGLVDPPKGFDYQAGIIRAGDVAKEMKHEFIHGKERGLTTHIKELNPHFNWRKGFLYCNTGYPQHGKTEGTQYLQLLASVYDGAKWGAYSPENYPAKQYYDSLVHTYIGKSVDPHYKHNQMSMQEYERGIEFVHEHFFYVYYKGMMHTPQFLREVTAYLHAEKGLFGFVKDPWNKLAHIKPKFAPRDDEYLQWVLPMEQQQARELDIVQIINAHPKRGYKEPGKPWPVPDQDSIANGAMWDNMCDCICAWHRPEYWKDKKSTYTEFHVHKMKMQQLMGIPGYIGFDFNRQQARYLIDGLSPLAPHIVQESQSVYEINKLPESTFEQSEAPF